MNTETKEIENLKKNPRKNIIQAIKEGDAVQCLLKTSEIHGHFCPGSALGVMAALYGLKQPEVACCYSEGFEDLMAIIEINACFADGIQAVSGCTLGNNSLIYRDLGKHAVTFIKRGNEKGVRVCMRPGFSGVVNEIAPEFYPLLEKVIIRKDHSEDESKYFKKKAMEAAFSVIKLPFDRILTVKTVSVELPGYAPITESVVCSNCKEQVMITKTIKSQDGSVLCYKCASQDYYQLEGKGITVMSETK